MTNLPILTILVPAYNVEKYLEKCIFSMLPYEYSDSQKIEIIIINDGSKDNTLAVAEKLAYEHEQIKVINKKNGGHGSTINVAINNARGKYFRIIDGDDWVDSQNFIKFIDLLTHTDADLVLTDASYEFTDKKELQPYVSYGLDENIDFIFDNVLNEKDYFKNFGPVLASSTYKLAKLKEANFKITEHSAYVDMEFNAFAILYINTVVYYKLDIYRYLIGRTGQTVSTEVWKKKYLEHQNIIFNLINYIKNNKYLTVNKKNYIIERLIVPMVDSQIFMYDQICKLNELKNFLKRLSDTEDIYSKSISYIFKKNGDSKKILNNLDKFIISNDGPIIKINVDTNIANDDTTKIKKYGIFKLLKKILKYSMPYGIIRLYQRHKYGF